MMFFSSSPIYIESLVNDFVFHSVASFVTSTLKILFLFICIFFVFVIMLQFARKTNENNISMGEIFLCFYLKKRKMSLFCLALDENCVYFYPTTFFLYIKNYVFLLTEQNVKNHRKCMRKKRRMLLSLQWNMWTVFQIEFDCSN